MIKDIFCCDKIYINIKFTIFNHFLVYTSVALSDSHGYTDITTIHPKDFFHLPEVKSVTIKQ